MTEPWTFSITAAASVEFACGQVESLRGQIQKGLASEGRPSNLRHVDDQAIAALAAVRNLHPVPADWGVLATSHAPGRRLFRPAAARFKTEGAWTVSPHIIPNCSLHSISGLVSVSAGLRGLNLGVGGAVGCEGEIWPVAAGLLTDRLVPGLILICTYDDERFCGAVAIAASLVADGRTLLIKPGSSCFAPRFEPRSFARSITATTGMPLRASWSLPAGLTLTYHSSPERGRVAA
ncbi:MAG: hypothetical protein K1X57_12685 [Gemmataceae bacterium]|nr:hypothetical protein [Gemmataceae bacterium]